MPHVRAARKSALKTSFAKNAASARGAVTVKTHDLTSTSSEMTPNSTTSPMPTTWPTADVLEIPNNYREVRHAPVDIQQRDDGQPTGTKPT